ncbi:MAG: RluA family pseudouridine synthase [Buchnera aphidicola (Periphyllus acericola)]|uniref:RluA family pseudouridine synthase n=1 Tax=Buchnera aphidicola TaxID=9 RepID=UPI0030CD11B9|nr:RluA family pseudouridine synthase [Buchnera aphidicola (Periphyllus acericola)]
MKNTIILNKIITTNNFNKIRLDKVLSILFSKYSRTVFKKSILNNNVYINNVLINSPRFKVKKGDFLKIKLIFETMDFFVPEKMYLDIIYEDKYLLVINKPSSLVVHPGFKNNNYTLLNGLLYYNKIFFKLPRAGIIHRLDKDTTGLIIIAKKMSSYFLLIKMMKKRKIIRKYKAVVLGKIKNGGFINAPIIRNKKKRTCMVVNQLGKNSITHYKILKNFNYSTLLKLRLETGRTHQIRVHMFYIRHPIVGDLKYKINYNYFCGLEQSKSFKFIKIFPRQALHAYKLIFSHPIKKKKIFLKINLPKDMENLLSIL